MTGRWQPWTDQERMDAELAAQKHACQRCGSDEWEYVDYGGCSVCRSYEDRAAEDAEDELCDYVPEIRPDGTVIG